MTLSPIMQFLIEQLLPIDTFLPMETLVPITVLESINVFLPIETPFFITANGLIVTLYSRQTSLSK